MDVVTLRTEIASLFMSAYSNDLMYWFDVSYAGDEIRRILLESRTIVGPHAIAKKLLNDIVWLNRDDWRLAMNMANIA